MLLFACLLVAILAAMAIAFLAAHSWKAASSFRRRVAADVAALYSDPGPEIGPPQVSAQLDSLPEPVRRYLRYAITDAAAPTQTLRLTHGGHFRTAPNQPWLPIEAEEHFTVAKPGFVWTARIRPAPLTWIDARDCLISGKGNMLVKLNSLLTIARAGGPQTDQSASLRWLMEAVWFPLAFLGDSIRFEPIDARSARVSLNTPGPSVSAVIEVDDEGKLVACSGQRYRDLGRGKSVLTPWTGRCSEYRDFSGFRIPAYVEGSWRLDTGDFPYVRFRVTTITYHAAGQFGIAG